MVIPEGETVEVAAGCVFRFSPSTGIKVHGTLLVQGTEELPVVFTSHRDRAEPIDSASTPQPFDWSGIFVSSRSAGSFFNHCQIRYSSFGIHSQSHTVVIKNGLFQENGQFTSAQIESMRAARKALRDAAGKGTAAGFAIGPEQRRAIRYGGIALTALGVGAGSILAARAYGFYNEQINWDPRTRSEKEYNRTDRMRKGSITGSTVSFVTALVGASSFGVTLAF
jgi:hypothetical protein